MIDYATLSLIEVGDGLEAVARDAQTAFGGLDSRQLNWRPDAGLWSVGQCFEHLLTANRLMLQAADDALTGRVPRTVWQRLPVVPGVIGRMLIRSQAPGQSESSGRHPGRSPRALTSVPTSFSGLSSSTKVP